MTYDKGAKDTHLKMEGWYQDKDGNEDKLTDTENPAWGERKN